MNNNTASTQLNTSILDSLDVYGSMKVSQLVEHLGPYYTSDGRKVFKEVRYVNLPMCEYASE